MAANLAGCTPASSATAGPVAAASPTAPGAPPPPQPHPSLEASPSSVTPRPSPSAGAVPSGPPEISNVNISYDSPTSPATFVLIAVDQKLPQKYGATLNASSVVATDSIAGLLSGDLQFALGGAAAPIEATVAGAPLKLLASFSNHNDYAIFAGAAIAQPSDLKGKRIGIFGIADNTDISLHAALLPYGLTVGQDVDEVLVGNDAQRLAATISGDIDACIIDEATWGTQARAQGLHTVISLMQSKLPWAGITPIATTSFIQQNPNTVLAVLKGLIDAVRFLDDPTNRDACIRVFAQTLKLSPDDPQVGAFYESQSTNTGVFLPTQGTESIANALKSIDPQKYGGANAADLVDASFLTQLASDGFMTLDS